jgi:hypothetical protein
VSPASSLPQGRTGAGAGSNSDCSTPLSTNSKMSFGKNLYRDEACSFAIVRLLRPAVSNLVIGCGSAPSPQSEHSPFRSSVPLHIGHSSETVSWATYSSIGRNSASSRSSRIYSTSNNLSSSRPLDWLPTSAVEGRRTTVRNSRTSANCSSWSRSKNSRMRCADREGRSASRAMHGWKIFRWSTG